MGLGDDGRILIVEDEAEFAGLVALWVERHGWTPIVARDGRSALQRFSTDRPDAVLLDLNLPPPNGWQLIEAIRARSQVPLLVVTALGGEADRIRGLVAGADDYVVKPVSLPELMARIQAALRRSRAVLPNGPEPLESQGVRLDPATRRVTVDGTEVRLSRTEFRVLRALLEHPGAFVPHGELLRTVWGPLYGHEDIPLLRATVRNLRRKLAAAVPGHSFIASGYGVGYRFIRETVGGEAGVIRRPSPRRP